MKIGDKIRDIEDGDCYYEGIIVELNPLKYKITNIIWCNEIDNSMNGEIIQMKWWKMELY
jgi:hypothetical protein|tara:strand:+ start:281 stop:460 length:180 start_codon:yes stop_codon:yes gene_type:complete